MKKENITKEEVENVRKDVVQDAWIFAPLNIDLDIKVRSSPNVPVASDVVSEVYLFDIYFGFYF